MINRKLKSSIKSEENKKIIEIKLKGGKMKKNQKRMIRKKAFTFFLVLGMCFLFVDSLSAVVDPERPEWRAEDNVTFLNSLLAGVLGRGPTPQERDFYMNRDLGSKKGRASAFWHLVNTNEYKNLFGEPLGEYHVRWKGRRQETTDRGVVTCRCYFYTKDPWLTGGQIAIYQYVNVIVYSRGYNSGVARAVTRMYANYDRGVCPHFDCGLNRGDVREIFGEIEDLGGNHNNNNINLVIDNNFVNFSSGNAWGTGQYSKNGIWWNSRGARSRYSIVNLGNNRPPGSKASTALYLQNSSRAAPHVYGTTCQRIDVQRGKQYTISFWLSAKNVASDGALYIVVDPQWTIRPINIKGGSYGWTKFSGSFTASANYIDLRIIFANTGEVWMTEIEMIEATR